MLEQIFQEKWETYTTTKEKTIPIADVKPANAKVEANLPVVVTCDKGMAEPRRANVKGIMMAKRAIIENITVQNIDGNTSLVTHSMPPQKPPGKSYDGSENVPEVVKLLRDEANVIWGEVYGGNNSFSRCN